VAVTPIESRFPVASGRRPWRTFPSWDRSHQRRSRSPRLIFAALAAASVAIGVLTEEAPDLVSPSLMVVPVLVGATLLPMRWLLPLGVLAVVAQGAAVAMTLPASRGIPTVLAFVLIVAVVLVGAQARSRLGMLGSRSESMLIELRERLSTGGQLPVLPGGWSAEVVHRSAHGESFGGDFLVSALSPDETQLEVALVDVSGNGLNAGTRALMLSGAFGGLLAAVPPDRFLSAANLYLLRQRWDEGFATGVHLWIDLPSGRYELGSAGHPPVVQFHAGSGSWEVTTASGPAFGLVDDAHFHVVTGQLLPGDAMLLYTDGLVERADRDISEGLDRLIGEAERLVAAGFESGANRLMAAVSDSESDDRACVLIWRG